MQWKTENNQGWKTIDSTFRKQMSYSFHYTAADTDSPHPEHEYRRQTAAVETKKSTKPITA